jgi:anti-sigma B factor antagonist
MALSISTLRDDSATVVAARGEIDLATAAMLAETIAQALDAPDPQPVVVDLAEVRFCDSSGIRVLVHGRRLADERGLSYRVVGATGVVLDVLEVTGVWAELSTPAATEP